MTATEPVPVGVPERLLRWTLLAMAGLAVLALATFGSFLVMLEAGYGCTEGGRGAASGPCLRTTVLPWTNLAVQVVLLVAGPAVTVALARRGRAPTARIAVTLTGAVAMVVVSLLVSALLLRLGAAGATPSAPG